MDAFTYQTKLASVKPLVPITGRYLTHAQLSQHERDFIGADLVIGTRALVRPTQRQAAIVADSTPSAIYWAIKRLEFREAILAGDFPLVPPRPHHMVVSDERLIGLAALVGADRWLTAASVAGL
jgi:hypothetical protein